MDSKIKLLQCPRTGSKLDFDKNEGTLKNIHGDQVAYLKDGVWVFEMHHLSTKDAARDTLKVFGDEWSTYSRWGWLDKYPDEPYAEYHYRGGLKADSKNSLHSKTKLNEDDFKEQIVLDAGCGNGRHASFSSKICKTLICVDASEAIFSASRNLSNRKNILFIKASLFNLPIKQKSVDVVYSIGVMQHTGSANLMLQSISRILKDGGLIGLNCYGTGTILYEILDGSIRFLTTRLNKSQQYKVAKILSEFSINLETLPVVGRYLYKILYIFLNIQPSKCIMFDWYSPKIATHYSSKQLDNIFKKNGLVILNSNVELKSLNLNRFKRWLMHGAWEIKLGKISPKE